MESDTLQLVRAERDDIKSERERAKVALRAAIKAALTSREFFSWGKDAWIKEGEEGDVLDTVEALNRAELPNLAVHVQNVRNLY